MAQKKRKRRPLKAPPKVKIEPVAPRKAKRTPITTGSDQRVRTSISFDDGSVLGLRYAAGKDYICTFRDISVAELSEWPMYRRISIRNMENWCNADKWVERRRAWREEYRQAMEKAIGTELVRTRLKYMKRGEKVLGMLFDQLMPEGDDPELLQPTSLESMANATRQFWAKVVEEKEKLADAIMPEAVAMQPDKALPALKPQLSQEEARAAALTIVRMRREQIRAAMADDEKKEGADQKPHMRVIEGEK